jgi:hypothetical protein
LAGGLIGLFAVAAYVVLGDIEHQGSGLMLAGVIIGADVGLGGLLAYRTIGERQRQRAHRERFVLAVRALRRAFRKAKVASHGGIGPQLQVIEHRWTEAHRAMQRLQAAKAQDRERISLFDEGLALTICHMSSMTADAIKGGPAVTRFHRLASAGEKLCRITAHHFD